MAEELHKTSYSPVLPQELVDMIVPHLSLQDLSRFSRTCKTLRSQTIKALFGSISMVWKGNALERDIKWREMPVDEMYAWRRMSLEEQKAAQLSDQEQKAAQLSDPLLTRPYLPAFECTESPRIDLLLRTVLQNPELASHILQLTLQAEGVLSHMAYTIQRPKWRVNEYESPSTLLLHHPEIADLYRNAIKNTGVSNSQQWEDAITRNDIDAHIGLLLSALPNVESITLGAGILSQNAFVPQMVDNLLSLSKLHSNEHPIQHCASFKSLKHVKLGQRYVDANHPQRTDDLSQQPSPQSYLPWFHCPSLETILAWGVLPLDEDDCTALLPKPEKLSKSKKSARLLSDSELPALENVCLLWSDKMPFELIPRQVSKLHYQHGLDGRENNKDVINFDRIQSSLSLARETLTHLCLELDFNQRMICCPYIDEDCGCWFDAPSYPMVGRISFRDFPVLVDLHISAVPLLGSECFLYINPEDPNVWELSTEFFDLSNSHKLWEGLPRSLERFVLSTDLWHNYGENRAVDGTDDWIAMLREALEKGEWRSLTPQLRPSDIHYGEYRDNDVTISSMERRLGIIAMCESHGLSCEFIEIDDNAHCWACGDH